MRRILPTLNLSRAGSPRWTQTYYQMEMDRGLFVAALLSSRHFFGNAPARVRPVEAPIENGFRQTEREVSPLIVMAFVIITPLWLLAIFSGGEETKRETLMQWALARQRKLVVNPASLVSSPK
ncbi:unnamed protein product [Phytomonas sp. EM1]|nr:unnamed protein product [Phytomonas sp. EM1]|eukprot:CCW63732.1 unnamed protein product [Phytomonas sp. isolate EM1]